MNLKDSLICIVGLGYVGLPLAEALAKKLKVIGFDLDQRKVFVLQNSPNDQQLTTNNQNDNLTFTTDPEKIRTADFFILCIPTPVTKAKFPDLSYVEYAARIVGSNMKRNSTVILESTVYPGVTEEIVKPILEQESGLSCGPDFRLAYSPERVNPGDEEHTLQNITKIVAGVDEETTQLVADLYRLVTGSVYCAPDIRTAEAAKVIENIQRDLNIALVNELAIIFNRLGLDTREVLNAAATKWNFHRYTPGLVGGHCIPVDPYYLVYKAKELGYHPQVILAGRAINDYMPKHVAELTIKSLNNAGKVIKSFFVGALNLTPLLGITYKEDVADTRESPAKEIITELAAYGIEVLGYDPHLDNIENEFKIKKITNLNEAPKLDAIILAVAHKAFREITLEKLKNITNSQPVLIDVRRFFKPKEATEKGFYYQAL
ncbi:MAG: nucleotide sugar dehydrogenase [Peptococcaceae bacterium]